MKYVLVVYFQIWVNMQSEPGSSTFSEVLSLFVSVSGSPEYTLSPTPGVTYNNQNSNQ